jgi:hypothetical protein
VIVQRKDAAHRVTGLDDPALKTMRIGVHLFAADQENTPPAMALSAHGVVGNLQGFPTTYTGGQNHPDDIIKAVISDSIQVAIVWGPIAGYYAKQLGADLTLIPVDDDTLTGIPFGFSMGMATRRRDKVLRDSLQKFLENRATEIRSILETFGVPLLPIPGDSAKPLGAIGAREERVPTRSTGQLGQRVAPAGIPVLDAFGWSRSNGSVAGRVEGSAHAGGLP